MIVCCQLQQLVACSLLSSLLSEYSNGTRTSRVGLTWEQHCTCKIAFEVCHRVIFIHCQFVFVFGNYSCCFCLPPSCSGSCGFFVRIDPICFLARCCKRCLKQVTLVLFGLVVWVSWVLWVWFVSTTAK